MLLEEEMRRSIVFCEWKARWWEQQRCVTYTRPLDGPLRDGLVAYALEHERTELLRAEMWRSKWAGVRQEASRVLVKYLDQSLPGHNVSLPDEEEVEEFSDDEAEDDGDLLDFVP